MENNKTIKPCKPIAPWLGGKSRLAKTIDTWINTVPHECYAEPFIGMGGVFLRRTKRVRAEVINDYNREIVNLFRIIQEHHQAFLDILRWKVSSRAEFERFCATDPTSLTDLNRAALFLYQLKCSFAGKIISKSYGTDTKGFHGLNPKTIAAGIEALHERLCGVNIECLNYIDFIKKYDRSHTLFYLDPPYYGSENEYGKGLFSRADFERLSDLIAGIKGRFILSLNDTPQVRCLFGAFQLHEVKTAYSSSKGGGKQEVTELLIHNLPETPLHPQQELI